MRIRSIAVGVAALAVATTSVAVLDISSSSAAGATVVSTPTAPNGWAKLDAKNGGVVTYVGAVTDTNGASATGNGSLLLQTPANTDKADYYRSVDPADPTATTPLSGLAGLGYRLDAASTGPQVSYQIKVLGSGSSATGGFTTLVWEPYMQPGQGAFVDGDNTWHSYTGLENGYWWSTKSIPVGGGALSTFQHPYPLSQIIANNPNAVVYQYGVNLGTYNAGGLGYVDDVSFNGTTTDFELDKVATNVLAEGVLLNNFKLNGGKLIAHLTDDRGTAMPNRVLTFSTGSTRLCQSVTDATGTATCSAPSFLVQLILNGYTATFAGDVSYLGSSDRAYVLGS